MAGSSMGKCVRWAATGSILAMALSSTSAFAQDAQAEDEGASGQPIIVTATLREADVQDIPLAVTAVSPEALERQGIADIKLLSSISPSFNIQSSQTESQGTSIRIRGVGTTGNNTGLESAVGVFIDGIYQSRPGIALGDLVDLERLEILRGPQGTLFGRNTSAGALNVTTKRPNLNRVEGFANASYGNFDFANIQGGVSVPITEGVAGVRVSGSYRKRDGLLNSSTGADSLDRDRYIVRGQFLFEPSDSLSIRLIGDYAKADEHCCDAVIIRETELAPFFAFHGLPSDGVTDFGPGALDRRNSNGQEFRNGQRQYGFSGEILYDLSDNVKLTYIGGYRDFRANSDQESDFVSLNIFTSGNGAATPLSGVANFPSNVTAIKTLTQELRIQGSALDDKLDFLIGGFYGDEKIRENQGMTLGSDFQRALSAGNFGSSLGVNPLFAFTALGNAGVPVNAAGNFAINDFGIDSESFSVFTHNVFDLTDNISVTFGARYVDETKDGFFDQRSANTPACQAIANGVLNRGIFNAVQAGSLASGASAAVAAATATGVQSGALGLTCFPFAVSTSLAAPAATGGGLLSRLLPVPREFTTKFTDNELTYTGQLSYNTNEGTLVYASFSHGFKSGGFNLDPTSSVLSNSAAVLGGLAVGNVVAPIYFDPRFKSEKVDAYELGLKTEFADGRIKANLAVFQMDMTDFQVLEFTGVQFLTFNVDNARSRGAELELFGRFDPYMSINMSMTYVDAKYGKDCDKGLATSSAIASIRRLCGATLTNAPKFAGVFGVTYDGPLNSSGIGLLANFNANYSSSRRTSTIPTEANLTPVPFDIQEAYIKMNARLGLNFNDGAYGIEAWVNNISDEVTRGITANTPLRGGSGTRSRIGFIEEPRTYGITARVKF